MNQLTPRNSLLGESNFKDNRSIELKHDENHDFNSRLLVLKTVSIMNSDSLLSSRMRLVENKIVKLREPSTSVFIDWTQTCQSIRKEQSSEENRDCQEQWGLGSLSVIGKSGNPPSDTIQLTKKEFRSTN